MDNAQVNELVDTIKKRFNHNSAKKILKEKYESKMLFAESGGMWKASPELIVLLSSMDDDNIVLIDTYENPCYVNRQELLTKAKQCFQEQTNAWFAEYQELNNER